LDLILDSYFFAVDYGSASGGDNGNLRDELLNGEIFDTLWEVKVLSERWRRDYSSIRLHSSLG